MAGWIFLEKPRGVPRPHTHTHGPLNRPRRVEPPLVRPALRRASGPHHLVRGWRRGSTGVSVVQSRRALSHTFPVAGGRGSRRSGALDGLVRRRGSAPCAHHARIHLRDGRGCWWRVSTPRACLHCSSVDGKRLTDHAWAACRRRALAVHWSASGGVLAELRGAKNKRAHLGHRREPGADWGRTRCMTRGRGRRPRAVAVSLAREDHTTTPPWRARAEKLCS